MPSNLGYTLGGFPRPPPSSVHPSQVDNANNSLYQAAQADGGNNESRWGPAPDYIHTQTTPFYTDWDDVRPLPSPIHGQVPQTSQARDSYQLVNDNRSFNHNPPPGLGLDPVNAVTSSDVSGWGTPSSSDAFDCPYSRHHYRNNGYHVPAHYKNPSRNGYSTATPHSVDNAATNRSSGSSSRGPGGFTPPSGGNAYGTSPYRDGRNHPQPEGRALHAAASNSSVQSAPGGGNGFTTDASRHVDNGERTRQVHVAARNFFTRSSTHRNPPSTQAQAAVSSSHGSTAQQQTLSGAAVAVLSADASSSQATTEFTCFPKLPIELRVKVWNACVIPRLVEWGPGGAKVPGYRQANQESRRETAGFHRMIIRKLPNAENGKYGMYVDFEQDVLYRKCEHPKLLQLEPINARLAAHPGHRLSPLRPSWTRGFKRLLLTLDDVFVGCQGCRPRRGYLEPGIWKKLQHLCPNLEELIIVLYANPNKKNDLEELRPARSLNYIQWTMQVAIQRAFEIQRNTKLEDWPALANIKLTFMQL